MAATQKKTEEELIEAFLNGPLIVWLESCLPRPEVLSGYGSLLDGTIVNSVWLQIDPEPQNHLVKVVGLEGAALVQARAKNFNAIVRNLRALYEEELGQTILVVPDCSVIGQAPESKAGLEHMKLLLTLLLGAAVQCPNKELFIGRIKELDVETQHAIVELIKLITDSQTIVLTPESVEQLQPEVVCAHLMRLAKERDLYHTNWINSMNIENDGATGKLVSAGSSTSNLNVSVSSTTATTDSNHLAVELADMKSKLRKLRQELEEKSESFMEIKEELEHKSNQYEKLRLESQEWYAEARKSSAYRDEVDVLREKADRVERLEMEIQRLREKLSDSEFYKSRVEELREDNRMLLETKEMLEDQLHKARKRSDHAMTLESEIIKYKQKLNDLTLERDVDKSKLQELLEENAQLQLTAKNLVSGGDLNVSASDNDEEPASGDNSLSEQLTNNAQTRVLKLELENRRLAAALESMRESSFQESSAKILELEKEKKKLSLKLDQLQDNCSRLNQQNSELEDVFKNALDENKKLQDALDAKQQTVDKYVVDREQDRTKIVDFEQQIETLSKEKQRIVNLSESIQRRADDLTRSLEIKSKEADSLKERIMELDAVKAELYALKAKFASSEKENSNLTREVSKLKETLEEKDKLLDENVFQIEQQAKEVQRFIKELETSAVLQIRVQELEKENQDLASQRKMDAETIATLQNDLVAGTLETKKFKQGLEKLGLDEAELNRPDLNVENLVERLVKNPESFKTVREVMLNVGRESETSSATMCVLCHRQEIYTVEKDIEFSSGEKEEPRPMSITMLTTDHRGATTPKKAPTSKIVVNLEMKEQWEHQWRAEMETLQVANDQLQAANARQQVEVSTLQSQITSLNTQYVAQQLANSQLAAEKDGLMKQLDAVKAQNESLHHDQVTLQCLHEQLSAEYEQLNKEKELLKIANRDLKSESRAAREHAAALEKLVEELRAESESMRKGNINLGNLRAEHSKLKDDFKNLFVTNERFKHEYKNVSEQYRNLRNENGRLKLQITDLNGELNNQLDRATALDIELSKANQQCDMLFQMNQSLDVDRKTLMDHVSQLLAQYHELLSHSLEDKQHYHDEEKVFTDKVNHLYRQKEKLEEKIMEHYRKLENCSPKKKTFGSNMLKKLRKTGSDLMSRVPNRNRRSWIDEPRLTQSQFTLGSESGGNESDNSTEEPPSAVSDTTLLARNAHLRQSLQRKPSEPMSNVLLRGGVRGSFQASGSNRNSFPSFESVPDMSSNALGQAGTRRTVYLPIDDNQKLPDSAAGGATVDSKSGSAAAGTQAGTASDNNGQSTFLMYNKISNVIGATASAAESTVGNTSVHSHHSNGSGDDAGSRSGHKDGKKKNQDSKNRESAIWYEYGCV